MTEKKHGEKKLIQKDKENLKMNKKEMLLEIRKMQEKLEEMAASLEEDIKEEDKKEKDKKEEEGKREEAKKEDKKELHPVNVNESEVTRIVHELGIPANIRGYQYIRTGIVMALKEPEILGSITKWFYPDIAKVYKTTPSRVERAIRHAISISMKRADIDVLYKLFGHSVSAAKGTPTNSEFMATVVDYIRYGN